MAKWDLVGVASVMYAACGVLALALGYWSSALIVAGYVAWFWSNGWRPWSPWYK